MPNPKDKKLIITENSISVANREEVSKKANAFKDKFKLGTHYPGCHKVHLECANKKIEEAKNIINRVYISERDLTQIELEWLESLGEK